jgi:hypothetical protein
LGKHARVLVVDLAFAHPNLFSGRTHAIRRHRSRILNESPFFRRYQRSRGDACTLQADYGGHFDSTT